MAEYMLPDRLVTHPDAPGGQHLFDHVQTERKRGPKPDRPLSELGG
jgi:hypothetical protein